MTVGKFYFIPLYSLLEILELLLLLHGKRKLQEKLLIQQRVQEEHRRHRS
jgi:hypothetical protein